MKKQESQQPKPKSKMKVNSNRSKRQEDRIRSGTRSSPTMKSKRKPSAKSPRPKTSPKSDKIQQHELNKKKRLRESGTNNAKLRKRRRLTMLKDRIMNWGQRHKLPYWAQNRLMKKLKEDQMRRKQGSHVRQKLLGKESEVVAGMLKGKSGEDIYPISRKQKPKISSKKDLQQKSSMIRTKKTIRPKSNLAPLVYPEENIIYLPYEKKIHEYNLNEERLRWNKEKQPEVKEPEPISFTEETSMIAGEKENEVTLIPDDILPPYTVSRER